MPSRARARRSTLSDMGKRRGGGQGGGWGLERGWGAGVGVGEGLVRGVGERGGRTGVHLVLNSDRSCNRVKPCIPPGKKPHDTAPL